MPSAAERKILMRGRRAEHARERTREKEDVVLCGGNGV